MTHPHLFSRLVQLNTAIFIAKFLIDLYKCISLLLISLRKTNQLLTQFLKTKSKMAERVLEHHYT